MSKLNLETNLKISKVRDSEFAHIDDPRAIHVLKKVWESAQGLEETTTLNNADCSMLIALIQSQEYCQLISSKIELE